MARSRVCAAVVLTTIISGTAAPIAPAAAQASAAAQAPARSRSTALPPAPPPPAEITGGWGGARTALAKRGITITANYIGESAWVVDGGKRRGIAYAQQVYLGADFDLQPIAGWRGAKVHVVVVDRQGRSVNKKIGNILAVQEIFSRTAAIRLVDLSLEQSFADDHLNIVAGRIVATNYFVNSPAFCNFQSLGICGVPYSLAANGSLSYFPLSSWGARVRVKTGTGWQLQVGAFEVNPKLGKREGFDFSLNGATGVSVPVELLYRKGRGTYKLGIINDTSDAVDLSEDDSGQLFVRSGRPARVHAGRSDVYAMFEYVVAGSPDPGKRKVTVYGGVTRSKAATAFFQDYEHAAVVIEGPLRARPRDAAALLFVRGGISRDLARSQRAQRAAGQAVRVLGAESVIEADYRFAVTRGLTVTPNLQRVFDPGGDAGVKDATVLALKISADF